MSVADFGAQWNPANSDHTHQVWGWTDSGGGHDHGASSAGGEASHTHPASAVGAGSSHTHTHTQGAVTQPTAHGAISAHSAHDTPSHLPPYLAIPYIIKT